jgi:hypothetical protein
MHLIERLRITPALRSRQLDVCPAALISTMGPNTLLADEVIIG